MQNTIDGRAGQFIITLSGLNNLTNRRRAVKTATLYNIIKRVVEMKGLCSRNREKEKEKERERERLVKSGQDEGCLKFRVDVSCYKTLVRRGAYRTL
jgi:hypothetical protein